jgi:hypothetical protein
MSKYIVRFSSRNIWLDFGWPPPPPLPLSCYLLYFAYLNLSLSQFNLLSSIPSAKSLYVYLFISKIPAKIRLLTGLCHDLEYIFYAWRDSIIGVHKNLWFLRESLRCWCDWVLPRDSFVIHQANWALFSKTDVLQNFTTTYYYSSTGSVGK